MSQKHKHEQPKMEENKTTQPQAEEQVQSEQQAQMEKNEQKEQTIPQKALCILQTAILPLIARVTV